AREPRGHADGGEDRRLARGRRTVRRRPSRDWHLDRRRRDRGNGARRALPLRRPADGRRLGGGERGAPGARARCAPLARSERGAHVIRPARWLPISLALHAATLGGAVWVVYESSERALFVDL